ncbi:hypothetical protein N7468_005057 [Penicillium chermesinum]|uniref:Major facilitator superfamily (MFS) profile domain-containing protein n=1 Tax=Penicillium chermesinum TaxID=63820 RepID=A0A9W9TML7_9EURO|nr:uncharacterized protein N7468_005057 [Penicillium chermesinum]KAJ5232101.1 hypothetical protein N7468_005057 [Penicillium chermesinum]
MAQPFNDDASTKPGVQTEYRDVSSGGSSTISSADTSRRNSVEITYYGRESQDVTELHRVPTTRARGDSHMGEALEKLASTMSRPEPLHDGRADLCVMPSRRSERSTTRHSVKHMADVAEEELGSPNTSKFQGRPAELNSLTSEIIFVFVCSAGLLFFAFLIGDITVNQEAFKEALGITNSELPWLLGAYLLPLSLSVVISGSLSDLAPPRMIMVFAFAWLTVWNVVGAFCVHPSRAILFYIVRAMQGLSIGVLVSASMSILGRVYNPGLRKNRVFSAMSATSPFGFWLGCIQGGAMKSCLYWIFGSNAIIAGLCLTAAYATIPPLRPVADIAGTEAPTLRQFDYLGASAASIGCVCILFGLTQGSVTEWSPYTAIHAPHPATQPSNCRALSPAQCYRRRPRDLGREQNSPHHSRSLYLLCRDASLLPGPRILSPPDLRYDVLGDVFPRDRLVTFGPDLSFAAASIYITSNVRRSYQGSAGSLLVTMQNLSCAVFTSIGDAIGTQVEKDIDGNIGLTGLRAIWWFALAAEIVAAAITLTWVRIPKEEEKEHVTDG